MARAGTKPKIVAHDQIHIGFRRVEIRSEMEKIDLAVRESEARRSKSCSGGARSSSDVGEILPFRFFA